MLSGTPEIEREAGAVVSVAEGVSDHFPEVSSDSARHRVRTRDAARAFVVD